MISFRPTPEDLERLEVLRGFTGGGDTVALRWAIKEASEWAETYEAVKSSAKEEEKR